jgi:hypothetical protein
MDYASGIGIEAGWLTRGVDAVSIDRAALSARQFDRSTDESATAGVRDCRPDARPFLRRSKAESQKSLAQ